MWGCETWTLWECIVQWCFFSWIFEFFFHLNKISTLLHFILIFFQFFFLFKIFLWCEPAMQVQQYKGKQKFQKLNRVVSTLGKALSSRLYPTLKEASIGKVKVVEASVVVLVLESATDILTGYQPGYIYLFTRRGWKINKKNWCWYRTLVPNLFEIFKKIAFSNHPDQIYCDVIWPYQCACCLSTSDERIVKTVNSLQFFHENCRAILWCFWINKNRRFSDSVLFPKNWIWWVFGFEIF